MTEENATRQILVGPDGQEQITIGTPEFPVQIWSSPEESKRAASVPWHWHPELEINISTIGDNIMLADGRRSRMAQGQAVFINRGVLHSMEKAPGHPEARHDCIVFNASLVGGASGSVFWRKYLAPVMLAPECRCVMLRGENEWERQALAQIRAAIAVWTEKAPGYEVEVRAALSRVICLLAENCVQHAQAPSERELRDAERIRQMVDFIRDHRTENITTAQIAASAAISVSECLRCFRRMMDLTPKEYQRQHRIRHAARMLEQTDLSISRIGEECGFEDMSYFARVFREEKGCTPSEYRERNK